MKTKGLVVILVLGPLGAAGARDGASHGLRWSGPTTIVADVDGVARARFTTSIAVGSTPSPGILGWSFVVLAEGEEVRITNATISGTPLEAHLEGATVEIERIESAEGKGYRMSVLFPEPRSLLPGMHDSIPVLHVDAELTTVFPQSFGRLRHGDSEAEDSPLRPRLLEAGGREVRLHPADLGFTALDASVCGDVVLGFSLESLDSDFPFEGILGGPGGSGNVVLSNPKGAPVTAHVDLVTLLHPDLFSPVWAWTLSVVLEGDANPVGVSFMETPARPYFQGGFERTSIADPAANGGRKGFTSVVSLTISQPSTYPHIGSRSILRMDLVPTSVRGIATLRFDELSPAPGRIPVTNQVTIQGSSVLPCNKDHAALEMIFSDRHARFRRGDANGDGRINVSDGISILSALIENAGDACLASRDVNADGKIDLTDAIHLLSYLFQGGVAPEEPFGPCSPHPSDGLGCLQEQETCR